MSPQPQRRVLIVDDEERDWTLPMELALQRAARFAGLASLQIDKAMCGEAARDLIARNNYALVSLDMRLPERAGEVVTADTGLKLAGQFTALDYPKYMIYSQTLSDPRATAYGDPSDAVLALRADSYAKPSAASRPPQPQAPLLSVRQWAQRVVDYLDPTRLQLVPDPGDSTGKRTVLGVQFKRGPLLLPPPLARAVARLADDGHGAAKATPLVASIVHETLRWAVAQSAVLCAASGCPVTWPADASAGAALRALGDMLPLLGGWNWSNYWSPAALDALAAFAAHSGAGAVGTGGAAGGGDPPAARASETADSAASVAPLALHHCLDIAAYWARHPVLTDLHHSRDGWTALPLRAAALPRRRELLALAHDFSAAADRGGWQGAWALDSRPDVPARYQLVSWQSVLEREPGDGTRWWLRLHQAGDAPPTWMDIDSGVCASR